MKKLIPVLILLFFIMCAFNTINALMQCRKEREKKKPASSVIEDAGFD